MAVCRVKLLCLLRKSSNSYSIITCMVLFVIFVRRKMLEEPTCNLVLNLIVYSRENAHASASLRRWGNGPYAMFRVAQVFQKTRENRSLIRSRHIIFFNICNVVHREFFPLGQTINRGFYAAFWIIWESKFGDKIWFYESWRIGFILYGDNPPCYRGLLTPKYKRQSRTQWKFQLENDNKE